MFYRARWYDPLTGRFLSADSLVPGAGNPQNLNRYMYVLGNPLKFTDPTGHFSEDEIMKFFGVNAWEDVLKYFQKDGELEGRWGWLEVLKKAQAGNRIYFFDDFISPPNSYGRRLVYSHPQVRYSGYFQVAGAMLTVGINGGNVTANFAAQLGGAYHLEARDGRAYEWDNDFILPNKFDPGRVDWLAVGIDSASTLASLLGANEVVQAVKPLARGQTTVTGIGRALTVTGIAYSGAAKGDGIGAALGILSFIPGPIGGGMALASVVRGLGDGFIYDP